MLIFVFLSLVYSSKKNEEDIESKTFKTNSRFSMDIPSYSSLIESTTSRSSLIYSRTAETTKFASLPDVHGKALKGFSPDISIEIDRENAEKIELEPRFSENSKSTGKLRIRLLIKKQDDKKNKVENIFSGCKCFAKMLKWIVFFVILIIVAFAGLKFDNQIGWAGSLILGDPSLFRTLLIVLFFVTFYIMSWRCICRY